ncbi:MAG: Fpg/Nei family DNA glycosylase, partial [Armatimonadota bacterium]
MPELPEVETARRGLCAHVAGAVVRDVVVHDARVLRGCSERALTDRLEGSRLGAAGRRGKHLLIPIDGADGSAWVLCIHFMMRGGLRLREASEPPGRYDRVSLALSDGRALRYEDAWGWGGFRAISPEEVEREPALSSMGPEPLGGSWNAALLGKALRGRSAAVKTVLLDQTVVAGVGNI